MNFKNFICNNCENENDDEFSFLFIGEKEKNYKNNFKDMNLKSVLSTSENNNSTMNNLEIIEYPYTNDGNDNNEEIPDSIPNLEIPENKVDKKENKDVDNIEIIKPPKLFRDSKNEFKEPKIRKECIISNNISNNNFTNDINKNFSINNNNNIQNKKEINLLNNNEDIDNNNKNNNEECKDKDKDIDKDKIISNDFYSNFKDIKKNKENEIKKENFNNFQNKEKDNEDNINNNSNNNDNQICKINENSYKNNVHHLIGLKVEYPNQENDSFFLKNNNAYNISTPDPKKMCTHKKGLLKVTKTKKNSVNNVKIKENKKSNNYSKNKLKTNKKPNCRNNSNLEFFMNNLIKSEKKFKTNFSKISNKKIKKKNNEGIVKRPKRIFSYSKLEEKKHKNYIFKEKSYIDLSKFRNRYISSKYICDLLMSNSTGKKTFPNCIKKKNENIQVSKSVLMKLGSSNINTSPNPTPKYTSNAITYTSKTYQNPFGTIYIRKKKNYQI